MIITIAGRYGSGARDIARKVASELNYKVYDDEIVAAAYETGGALLDEDELKYYDEGAGSLISDDIAGQSETEEETENMALDVLPLDLRLSAAIQGALNRLADKDNCVIVGRCANYYLRNRNNAVILFITDFENNKIKRIMKRRACNEDTARKIAEMADKRREDVYSFFTGGKWDDADNYGLCVNTGVLGEDGTARLITELVKIKENQL